MRSKTLKLKRGEICKNVNCIHYNLRYKNNCYRFIYDLSDCNVFIPLIQETEIFNKNLFEID
jgi:hypothetical protein